MIFNPSRFSLLTNKSYSVRTTTALTKNFCLFAKGRFNFYLLVVFKSPQETLQLIKTCWVNWRRSDSNSKMKKNESNSKWVIQLLRLVFSLLITVFSKFLEGSVCVIFIFGIAIKTERDERALDGFYEVLANVAGVKTRGGWGGGGEKEEREREKPSLSTQLPFPLPPNPLPPLTPATQTN